ncbi:unnamed protein product (macronuclear) [Paramecium tetraurelia]|uniref:VLIG-type G domain-containing protein n=1 Tax=Paramecium tetraurelia TaxID=5888 RepID=A0DKN2_PARTE|nr:uncharacterized protein GSPATT00017929001 [Paramecium tetraurelia]CAK83599.1 unnamed protein product [Paramecium tetraurelia]|eukprot:XP_001450996.1 hypothetical protein (macronuclear) [Paramecium tetraurelia strain d4-2]
MNSQPFYFETAFTIQKDLTEEYSEDKIQIKSNIKQLLNQLKSDQDKALNILGLYGYLETIINYMTTRYNANLQFDVELSNHTQACIGMIKLDSLLVFCYLIPENKKVDQVVESIETNLFRILIDLCQNIIILPTEKILQKWIPIKDSQLLRNKMQNYQSEEINSNSCRCVEVQQKLAIKQIQNYNLYYKNSQNSILFYDLKQEEYFKLVESYYQDQVKNIMLFGRLNEELEFPNPILERKYVQKINKDVMFSMTHYFSHFKDSVENGLYQQLQLKFSPQEFDFLKLVKFFLNHAFRKLNSFKDNTEVLKGPELIKEVKTSNIRMKSKELLAKLIRIVIKYINREFSKMQDFVNRKIKWIMEKIEIEQGVGQEFIVEMKLQRFKIFRNMDNTFKKIEFLDKDMNISKEKETKFQQQNYHSYQLIDFFQLYNLNEGKQSDYLLIMKCIMVESKKNCYHVYLLQENRKPVLVVIYTDLNNPYFYYALEQQTLYQFNLPKRIVISTLNKDKECIDTERVIELEETIYIIQYSYSEEYECFLLLSDDKKVYKWSANDQEFIQQLQSYQDEEGFVNEKEFDADYYNLIVCGSGKFYLLFKIQSVDIYDFNNTRISSIQFRSIYQQDQIYIFSDQYDSFILLAKNEDEQELYQLENFNKKSKLTSNQNYLKQSSNYILDLIKQSFIVYGKNSSMLDVVDTQSNFYCSQKCGEIIQDCFYKIQLQKYSTLHIQEVFEIKSVNSRALLNVLSSRVPIQLCTFEYKRLIVLSDGLNKLNQNFDCIQIDRQLKQISFGMIEELLDDYKKPIYVVSILGKQSGGKSYLLNQIFGIRFGVSSARCTDGIWCSQVQLQGHQFLILDCEGLFGQRRNNIEEITLLSFLTAISDLTIFNQCSSYDRHLNELFDNLIEANTRLKGNQLFKSRLMILVRDIYQASSQNAQQELDGQMDSIINSSNNELLKQLLKNGVSAQLMSYFELEQFDRDVNQIREQILENAKNTVRWQDAQSLFTSMKITLLQLSVKDTRNVQDYELNYQIHKLKEQSNIYWLELPSYIIKKEDGNNISQQIVLTQTIEDNFSKLLEQAQDIVRVNIEQDSAFMQKFMRVDKLIQSFANKRISYIISIISREIEQKLVPIYELDRDMKQNILLDCENELKQHLHVYKLCGQTCSRCYALCTQYNGHLSKNGTKIEKVRAIIQKKKSKIQMIQKQLDLEDGADLEQFEAAERLSLQELQVSLSRIKGDRTMVQRASALKEIQQKIYHVEGRIKKLNNMIELQESVNKEQEQIQQFNKQHICWSDTHLCEEKNCELLQSHFGEHISKGLKDDQCDKECLLCQSQCILRIGHSNNSLHYCYSKHVCQETCLYCAEQCTQDPFVEHKHMCNLRYCNKSCSLGCQRQCSEQHSHELENEHFCNCHHQCDKLCNLPGICTVDGYVKRVKMWKSNAGSLYGQTIYEQVRRKEKCFKLIPIGENSHDLGHACSNRKHLCDQQCPGCKAYCYLESGHTNLHHTIYHNVIEPQQSCFKLDEKDENIQFCRPETCDEYCIRLGRGHSHAVECVDEFLCYQQQLNKTSKYYKAVHVSDNLDHVLCKQFWEILGWEQPIRGSKRIEISKCNAKCQTCNKFCNYLAWHDKGINTMNHKFECYNSHQIKSINIALIIDWTDEQNIQIAFKLLSICNSIKGEFNSGKAKFAIILYHDHHPHKEISSPTFILSDFTDSATLLSKLKDVKPKKATAISDYPNAVLDGLHEQQQLSWSNKNSQKIVILLTQAPPHGHSKYHSFDDNYPKGCPCKLKEVDILKNYRMKQIHLIIPELSCHLNLMIKIFQSYLPNLHSINTNKNMAETIIKYLFKYLQISQQSKV